MKGVSIGDRIDIEIICIQYDTCVVQLLSLLTNRSTSFLSNTGFNKSIKKGKNKVSCTRVNKVSKYQIKVDGSFL